MNRATSPTGWARNPDGSPGYTWNPITGCLNHTNGLCKGGGLPCYAYKLANGRLKPLYLANKNTPNPAMAIQYSDDLPPISSYDPFYPRFWEERLKDIERLPYPFSDWSNNNASRTTLIEFLPINRHAKRKAVGIFPCDMSDLFGIGIPEEWTEKVLDAIRINSVDRFYLLTKQPQNLPQFSPFPDNAWVGVTATGYKAFNNALDKLKCVDAKVKYISSEPLLEAIPFNMERLAYCGISWLIIGACTGNLPNMASLAEKYPDLWLAGYQGKITAQPRIEWVREIVEAADKAGVKVFLKDNLKPIITYPLTNPWAFEPDQWNIRQEMPE